MKVEKLGALRVAVEQKFGKTPTSNNDFEELHAKLNGKTSSKTLKRIWGYDNDRTTVGPFTIELLAKYIDYSSYLDFLARHQLETEQEVQLYEASRIALLASKVHTDRFEQAFEMYQNCNYGESLALLSDTDREARTLMDSSTPFVESIESVVSEMYLKAQLLWGMNHDMEEVEEIARRALPLARSINDHLLLWCIYQDWALWKIQNAQPDEALELYDLAEVQAHILMLENPDSGTEQLTSTLNDKSYALTELGLTQQAQEVIQEGLKHNTNVVIRSFMLLNQARILLQEENIEEVEQIYNSIITNIEDFHTQNSPSNESTHILALSYYNLGILYSDYKFDESTAKEYFGISAEVFESREVQSVDYNHYRELAKSKL